MNAIKILAFALILAGAFGLFYGDFSYARDTDRIKLGKLEVTVKENERVRIPAWAGVSSIIVGSVLLFAASGQKL